MNDLLKIAYDAMDSKQADRLVVIDFRNHSPFVDYFIIGSARNERMAKSIIEEVEDQATMNGYKVNSISMGKESAWFLIDLGSIVCHVFYGEDREIYNLEGLWKDLPTIKM